MHTHTHTYKKTLIEKLLLRKGIWFHLIGLACVLWVLIRVTPAPHRSYYPCQRVSIPIALSYLAFWGGIYVACMQFVRKLKNKTVARMPILVVLSLLLCTFGGIGFAASSLHTDSLLSWTPIPNQPIGTPQGFHPGRVVWVWNPDATETDHNGFWWQKENNNQPVIDDMMSTGIQNLMGTNNETAAWDHLFKSFNQDQSNETQGYQPGEKIAIKVNLNNAWVYRKNPYFVKDNELDASPYVVKALLRQLVDVVGVAQEDITIFDASRQIPNWFYYRVYYETYPSIPLVAEFADVRYADTQGGAEGREKVVASSTNIFFTDGTGFTRTLPTCVTEAQYLINLFLFKRHPINQGVTFSGKNLFGAFIEPVIDIHPYFETSFSMGNTAPQVDLLAHHHLGAKTLLYIGDGLFGTKSDHRTIAKFQMHPFNNDWTNSLFFSQDPVAIDSVMYDFLYAEGTQPSEGSQNYLHQAAAPPPQVYDPEWDGVFLDNSLGVHEHWNLNVDIFSSERYVGSSGNGIDFLAIGKEQASAALLITKPLHNQLYVSGQETIRLPRSVIVGSITVETQINGVDSEIEYVEFYLNNELQYQDYDYPYSWFWDEKGFGRYKIQVIAYYDDKQINNEMRVWKLF